MYCVVRPLFGLILSLMLALTSQSMAVAGGASAATGQMVICTGTGPVTIYMDASGAPTEAPHLCADCILAFSDATVQNELRPFKQLAMDAAVAPCGVQSVLPLRVQAFRSRAPPALV